MNPLNEQDLIAAIHLAARSLEVAGTLVIVIGAIGALIRFGRQLWSESANSPVQGFRADLGQAVLLGLELMVAATIMNTVAIQPTPQSLAVLAGIVAIRAFLSVSLQVELDGRWPWSRTAGARA